MIVAGLGCRKDCDAGEIVALVERALAEAAQPRASLSALAAPAFKSDASAPREAAERLGLRLVLVSDDALRAAEAQAVTLSPKARAATGIAAIAESAALAAAGEGATLILPRIKSRSATCALARSEQP